MQVVYFTVVAALLRDAAIYDGRVYNDVEEVLLERERYLTIALKAVNRSFSIR